MTTSRNHDASDRNATSYHPAPDDPPPSRRFKIVFTTMMVVIAIGWAWVWHARTERLVVGAPPVLAVAGAIAADTAAGVVGDMLSVAIRRIGVPVIETGQLYALTGGRTTGAALVEAARELGATQVVQVEVRTMPDGAFEMEARRVDALTRDLVVLLRTRGANPFELVDRMAAQVALSMGLRVPDGSVADAMTHSLDAWTAYEGGLRAAHAGDTASALLRLDAALAQDPSFKTARQLHDHLRR